MGRQVCLTMLHMLPSINVKVMEYITVVVLTFEPLYTPIQIYLISR